MKLTWMLTINRAALSGNYRICLVMMIDIAKARSRSLVFGHDHLYLCFKVCGLDHPFMLPRLDVGI